MHLWSVADLSAGHILVWGLVTGLRFVAGVSPWQVMRIPEDGGRYEFKYAIPGPVREQVLERAGANVQADPHGVPLEYGTRGYVVHSLYFDTPDLADYTARLESRAIRVRLRIRTYGAPGQRQPVYLEDKRKHFDRVMKHRVKVGTTDDWDASDEARPWVGLAKRVRGRGQYAAAHFLRRVEDEGRIPVSTVHYVREAFIDPRPGSEQVRLTFDHDVSSTTLPGPRGLYDEPDVDLLPPGWMIMELKFGEDRPEWMRGLVRDLHLMAEPFSKFGLSVARGVRQDHGADLRFFTPHSVRECFGSANPFPARRAEPLGGGLAAR